MKVLALAGSPRKGGNSEILLDAFLEGASDAGAQVEKVRMSEMDIHPCIGCESCSKEGNCVFDDDMPEMYEKLLSYDIVVLASPVYFYSVTTYAKMLVDRCQTLWARRHVLKQKNWAPNGRGVLIATGATRGKSLFEGLRLTAKYSMEAMGKKLAACLFVDGVDEKKAINDHPDAIEKAKELGRRFASDPDYENEKGCTNG